MKPKLPSLGELRHVVRYQTKTETIDDLGQPVQTWADAVTGVRAKIVATTGREVVSGDQMQAPQNHLLSVHRPTSGTEYRCGGRFIDQSSKVYNVVEVRVSNDGLWLDILTVRNVAPEEVP